MREVTILNHATLALPANGAAYILLVEVAYERGLPETFQLVLAFSPDEQADKLKRTCPQAVLATTTVNGETGILCDGLYLTKVQMALLTQMMQDTPLPAQKEIAGKLTGQLVFQQQGHPL